ncbi:MAG: sirohydrochlorin chelatase [Firmicutes bacterium]|nr:sirohydrochlorin chelatase [Bacillota bacterium]
MTRIGVLYIGHGTRSRKGIAETRKFCRQVDAHLRARVTEDFVSQVSFLELCTPDIGAGVDDLVARGVRQIVVQPLLLFEASHARHDIPLQLKAASQRHKSVAFCCGEPFGIQPGLKLVAALRLGSVVGPMWRQRSGATTVLFVGRGSQDASAHRAFEGAMTCVQWFAASAFKAASRRAGEAVDPVAGAVRVAFVACTLTGLGLSFREALAEASSGSVVILPYLLFSGRLMEELERARTERQLLQPDCTCWLTEPLGTHPLAALAVADSIVLP